MLSFIKFRTVAVAAIFFTATFSMVAFVALPTKACACGMLMPRDDETISMSDERGAVVFDKNLNKEQLVIDFQMDGTSPDSALIVPTPVKSNITQVKSSVFSDLEDILNPRSHSLIDGIVPKASGIGSNDVEVLERKTVGSFEIAALKANSWDALNDWTDSNGFYLQSEAEAPIKKFIDNKFVLNVIKLKAGADTSEINPLKFTFGTSKLFYPLMEVKDSRDPYKDKSLDLYLLSNEKLNLQYADILNKPFSKGTLEDKVTRTSDIGFANLDFSAPKYYATYIHSYDYSFEPNTIIEDMNNPVSNNFKPFGVEGVTFDDTTNTMPFWAYILVGASSLLAVAAAVWVTLYLIKSRKTQYNDIFSLRPVPVAVKHSKKQRN